MDIQSKHMYVAIVCIIAILGITLFVQSSLETATETTAQKDTIGQAYASSEVTQPTAGITRSYPEAEPVYSYLKD